MARGGGGGGGGGEEEGGGGAIQICTEINIPQDLYGEILYRLPSEDLLNFKRVCKEWLRLISSNHFTQKHLQRSKADCNNLRVVVNINSMAEIIDCTNNTSKQIIRRRLLGCCDGLVLYYDRRHHKIAAFNPCTGESLLLVPLPDQNQWLFSWFGHHPSTGEYVLVLACWESNITIKLEVYSLSLDRNDINLLLLSSSTLDEPGMERDDMCRYNRICTLLHGRLHFHAIVRYVYEFSVESVILVYDFETNTITRMTPPVIEGLSLTLGVVDDCLCAIQRKQVWMMKEYGVEESWTKYAKVDGGIPLAFCPDGDVIITSERGTVSKYSLREREAKILCEMGHGFVALGCIDSLVSPTLLWRED